MVRSLVAFPILVLVVFVQTAVISNITLLAGHADLMLVVLTAWALEAEATSAWLWATVGSLLVSFVSEMPWPVVFLGYAFVILIAQILRRRVWQAPLLAMFSVVFWGSLVMNIFALLVLNLLGRPLPIGESFGLIIIPQGLLNLLFSIPVYAVMRDLTQWVHPVEDIE
jgi:hypothetical protein